MPAGMALPVCRHLDGRRGTSEANLQEVVDRAAPTGCRPARAIQPRQPRHRACGCEPDGRCPRGALAACAVSAARRGCAYDLRGARARVGAGTSPGEGTRGGAQGGVRGPAARDGESPLQGRASRPAGGPVVNQLWLRVRRTYAMGTTYSWGRGWTVATVRQGGYAL